MSPNRCYAFTDLPFSIKDQYSKIALISHPSHLDRLNKSDHSVLIVSCNWLLWQQAIAKRWHCIHADSLLHEDDMKILATDIFLRANDWVYDGPEDVTVFKGVSLGRQFVREISLVILECEYLAHICTRMLEKFSPSTVLYFDCLAEFSVLDSNVRCDFLASLCAERHVDFEDHGSPPDVADPLTPHIYSFAHVPQARPAFRARLKNVLNSLFETVASMAGSLRGVIGKKRPRILLLTSHMNGLPLLENFEGADVSPLYFVEWLPRRKDLVFWARNLAKGVLPVRLKRQALSKTNNQRIAQILERLEAIRIKEKNQSNQIVNDYVREIIVDRARFSEAAVDVCAVERLLDEQRPAGILTDSMQNSISTTFLELAKKYNSKTFATWTAHALLSLKQPLIGCDERTRSVLDYFFAWGKGHEDWLGVVKAKCASVRTGSMKSVSFKRMERPRQSRSKVLFLQYSVSYYDPCCERSRQYAFFVDAVRMLGGLGFENIRFKLHPGLIEKVGYQQLIKDHFDLNCTIVRDGNFAVHVEWSDIVIGPVHSGAMLEVMAAGKPYYPILLAPHSVNLKFLEDCPVYTSVNSLRVALGSDIAPNHSKALEYFTSGVEIENPVSKVWEFLRDYSALS